jgi:hypothetical protein
MKVERVEAKPLADKYRDELIVRAVEGIQYAKHWWTGRQRDSFVVALRDGKGNVRIFDAVLRRAVELDAREAVGLTTAEDLRAALDRTCA